MPASSATEAEAAVTEPYVSQNTNGPNLMEFLKLCQKMSDATKVALKIRVASRSLNTKKRGQVDARDKR